MVRKHISRDFSAHKKSVIRPTNEYAKFEIFSYDPQYTTEYYYNKNIREKDCSNINKTTWRSWTCYDSADETNPMTITIKYNVQESGDYRIDYLYEQSSYLHSKIEKNNTDKDLVGNYSLSQKGTVLSKEDVKFDGERKEIEINIPNEYENNKKLYLVSVDRLEGTGEFTGIEVEKENGKPDVDEDDFDIVKISGAKFDKDKIGKCFSDEQKLRVLLTFKGKYYGETITVEEVWEIKFRVKNNKLEAYYVVLNREKCIEKVEPPKEEAEVPSKPEKVESPKKEIEVPSESEKVEPPKEEIEIQD